VGQTSIIHNNYPPLSLV